MSAPTLFEGAQVTLVTGKGGVGKTTLCAGLAVREVEARAKGRAVLVEFGDGASGGRALAGAPKGVEHVVLRFEDALRRAATPLFGSAAVARLALDNFAMRPLVRAAPGVRELALLEAVRQLAHERPGVKLYVDMPATGHSLAWLRAPRQGRDFIAQGPLYDLCVTVADELLSPGRVSLYVVTLPERLVVEETVELCQAVARETPLAVERVVVNRVPPALPPGALDAARALAREGTPRGLAAQHLADVLAARTQASAAALAAIVDLGHARHRSVQLPLSPTDPTAREVAAWLRLAEEQELRA